MLLYLLPADGAERPSDAGVEQAQVFVDFGRGAHGGARVAAVHLLFDGDGGGDALDVVALGLAHASQELARVAAEAFHVAALPLGVEGVEGQRRLARAGQAGDDYQPVPRYFDVDVLQVVDACAFYDDGVFGCHIALM